MPITEQEFINELSPHLFWDVDRNDVNAQEHALFVIDRVMSRGSLEDFQLLKSFYGKDKIKEIVLKIRYLDDRVLHFCSAYFDLPITAFRCYTEKLSKKTHWNY
jgi:hypothetical protein